MPLCMRLSLLLLLAVAIPITTADARTPRREIVVRAGDSSLAVTGTSQLHAGLVSLTVENVGRGEHGIELVRLRRPLTNRQLVTAFAAENRELIESLGGIQQVDRGRPWQMLERLPAGSYALVDFGQNGPKPNYMHGLIGRFQVQPATDGFRPPSTVGAIAMYDNRFAFRLPPTFHGHGLVKIPNLGTASHEITLVRIAPGHTQHEVLALILGGATQAPKWASIVELVSVLDAGKTAYVHVDLTRGRYVALSLLDRPGSKTVDAQRGMIGTFDVR